jgi:hypothetical protein
MLFTQIFTFLAVAITTALPAFAAPTPVQNDPALVVRDASLVDRAGGRTTLADSIGKIITAISEADQNSRSAWVQKMLEGLGNEYPNHNAFIYHRFQGNFEWTASGDVQEHEVQWRRKDLVGATEYYYCVVFSGKGTLNKVKGDGGFLNWAFRGWFSRDGDNVTFQDAPA